MTVNNNDLAYIRTQLANNRTYLSYVRTGFAIAAIAGFYKKFYFILYGLIIIIGSTIQYAYIEYHLKNRSDINNFENIDLLPIIILPLTLLIFYLQFITKKKKII